VLAGTAHQRLVDAAAERILAGRTDVELVVGGEALWTVRRYRKAGETPPWSFGAPPVGVPIDLETWFLPTELAHGIVPAWLTFALLDDARRHWLRRSPADHRRHAGTLLAAMSEVAAASPHAWLPMARTPEALTTPGRDNRYVATPYTKSVVATPDVDMAAATYVTSHAAADRLGIPPERRVYLRSWGFGRDAVHLAARNELHASPAMQAVFGDTLARAGFGIDDIGVLDLYSCFVSSVDFARDALGLAADDPRGVTATGGLPFHGAPSANYMGHAVAAVVDRVRQGDGPALVTGVGMHMTKHVAAVYAAEPSTVTPPAAALEQRLEERPQRLVVAAADGPATVAAQAVVHGRDGTPTHAVTICTDSSGQRCYAITDDGDTLADMLEHPWTGRAVDVRATGPTNEVRARASTLSHR
jgi:acetyl-CoA C-acetyltransferase